MNLQTVCVCVCVVHNERPLFYARLLRSSWCSELSSSNVIYIRYIGFFVRKSERVTLHRKRPIYVTNKRFVSFKSPGIFVFFFVPLLNPRVHFKQEELFFAFGPQLIIYLVYFLYRKPDTYL